MINLIVVSDDKNKELGSYFLKCHADIVDFFNSSLDSHSNIVQITTKDCNRVNIENQVLKINSNPFVFIAYSHGNESSLVCNSNSYVKSGLNTKMFNKSFFYTNSCLCGKELGKELVTNGCLVFWGYDEESWSPTNEEYIDTSINCDNSGIKTFFHDNITILEAYNRMISYYNNKIDKYAEIDIVFASYLVKNKEALVLYGKTDLVKEDFQISSN